MRKTIPGNRIYKVFRVFHTCYVFQVVASNNATARKMVQRRFPTARDFSVRWSIYGARGITKLPTGTWIFPKEGRIVVEQYGVPEEQPTPPSP